MKKLALITFFMMSFYSFAGSVGKEAFAQVKEGKAVMFDVREADEVKSGMIERAVFFPKSKFDTDKKWKEQFVEISGKKSIYLYCRSGRRSEVVRELLKKNGIESVNLGGYEDLKKEIQE